MYRFDCGARRFAVKCFTQPVAGLEARYTAIGAHLAAKALPYTVDFEFLTEGIRVGGRWYPILKMEWLNGQRLDTYIGANLTNRRRLHDLIRQWCELVHSLAQASIAHGDLQHGNILVVDGALRLIDYDGMWVPALAGQRSNELGEPNYQSPQRGPRDFGPYLDNFSTWVIGISLYALATDPSLWARFNGGDKCLLFRRPDFEHPEASGLIKTLRGSPIADLGVVTSLFESLLYLPLRDVPTLDGSTLAGGLPEVSASPLPAWLADHVTVSGPASAPPARQPPAPPERPDPSWILELAGTVPPAPSAKFVQSVMPERLSLLLGGLVIALLIALKSNVVSPLAVGVLVVACNVVLFRLRYKHEPVIAVVDSILASAGDTAQHIVIVDRSTQAARQALKKRQESDEAFLRRLAERKQELVKEQTARVTAVRAVLITALQSTNQRRQTLVAAETAALRSLGAGPRFVAVANCDVKLNELTNRRIGELARALKEMQQRYILAGLASYSVAVAPLDALGSVVKARLVVEGVRTAADVSAHVRSIPGIGVKRMRSLLAWRAGLETMLSARMPKSLDSNDAARIHNTYDNLIEEARRQLREANTSFTAEDHAIRDRYAVQRPPLDEEDRWANAVASKENERIKAEYGQHYVILAENERKHRDDADVAIKLLTAKERELQKVAFGLHFQRVKLQAHLYQYEGVRFMSYIRRIGGLG